MVDVEEQIQEDQATNTFQYHGGLALDILGVEVRRLASERRPAASCRSFAAMLGSWTEGTEKEGSCTEGKFIPSALMLGRFTEGNDTGICLWAASRRSLAAFVP